MRTIAATAAAAALLAVGLFQTVSAQLTCSCYILIPQNPLTPQGLATPYQLQDLPGNTVCTQANFANFGAFVQAAVIDVVLGKPYIYNPLVIQAGTTPGINTTVLTAGTNFPSTAVVGIWFGFNGMVLVQAPLVAGSTTLVASNCVSGFGGSFFGQVSHCNAMNFYMAAENAILNGTLTVPALGNTVLGDLCPSVRDFRVVDQDQSDNVDTKYIMATVNGNAVFAQFNTANVNALTGQNGVVFFNPSDNYVISVLIAGQIGCTPWMVQDLTDPTGTTMVPAQPFNEIQAKYMTPAPQALVPETHPMAMLQGAYSLDKINAYRQMVNQPTIASNPNIEANGLTYCQNYAAVSYQFLVKYQAQLQQGASPNTAVGANLFLFLVARFTAAFTVAPAAGGNFGSLGCTQMGVANPMNTVVATSTTTTTTTNTTLAIGLGVGGGVLVLIIAGVGVFIVVQRRRAATTAANNFMAL